jgi:hypothetical protein
MSSYDLDYFQVDCSKKNEQVAFLQSMRQTTDETFSATLQNMLQPWKIFTDPVSYDINHNISRRNPNKYINYHLNQLRYC